MSLRGAYCSNASSHHPPSIITNSCAAALPKSSPACRRKGAEVRLPMMEVSAAFAAGLDAEIERRALPSLRRA